MQGDLNLLGGLLNGLAQGQMFTQQQSRDSELRAQQAEIMKLKQQEMKIKLQEQKQKEKIFDLLSPQIQQYLQLKGVAEGLDPSMVGMGGEAEPTLGQSFGAEASKPKQKALSAELAQRQIDSMLSDPVVAGIISEYTGLSGVAKMPGHLMDKTKEDNAERHRRELERMAQINATISAIRAGGGVTYDKVVDPNTQFEYPRAMPNNPLAQQYIPQIMKQIMPGAGQGPMMNGAPAIGGGQPQTRPMMDGAPAIGGLPSKVPALVKRERLGEDGAKYEQFFDPARQVFVGSPVKVDPSKGEESARTDFASAEVILDKLENLMSSVIPKDYSGKNDLLTVMNERVAGAGRKAAAMTQINPKAAEFDSFVQGTLAPMIRALGEKGALANQDVERALSLMPKLTDRPVVAYGKVKNIKDILTQAKQLKGGNQTSAPKKPTNLIDEMDAVLKGK